MLKCANFQGPTSSYRAVLADSSAGNGSHSAATDAIRAFSLTRAPSEINLTI